MRPQPDQTEQLAAVRLKSVSKAYGRIGQEVTVLNGVDLTVRQGECVFLAGPSGSGKTTLLSILGCILSPDQGTVHLFGEDILEHTAVQRSQFRLDHIGFVFQKFHLIRGLNALENVGVPLVLQGEKSGHVRHRAMAVLESVGLEDKAKSHPAQLSTGQCQRVALARALVTDPELILADEPTASLDAENGRRTMELLRRVTNESHKTVVVVTHDPRILQYADHVYCMENGSIGVSKEPIPQPVSLSDNQHISGYAATET